MRDFVNEDQAKKKICPLMQSEKGHPIFCMASNCMGWRWSHQDAGPNEPATGFCGMAVLPKYV